ncbi:hypothetical protein [Streptomyces carpaticus]|uniref:hypothetical protein n=1 Tax=Streptomyces carpaticus TaxID=285558 RepID=UPI0031F77BCB
MTARLIIEIACDGPPGETRCPVAATTSLPHQATPSEIRRARRADGWRTRRRRAGALLDLCPACARPTTPAPLRPLPPPAGDPAALDLLEALPTGTWGGPRPTPAPSTPEEQAARRAQLAAALGLGPKNGTAPMNGAA